MTTNIMIVGVGGQGTLLASRIIGRAANRAGLEVKVSEVHGMSQRGGSVVTYVRFGDSVASPIIEAGEADFILAFEELEALRWARYLKKDGQMIAATNRIDSMPIITGQAVYPDDIEKKLSAKGVRAQFIDALSLAKEAGTPKAVNVVLVGALAAKTALDKSLFTQAIEETVKPAFLEVNQKAFAMGYALAR